MQRLFDPTDYIGLFGREIPYELVNYPHELLHEGDMIESECSYILLRYSKRGYKLVTNNAYRYVSGEDLKQDFKKK